MITVHVKPPLFSSGPFSGSYMGVFLEESKDTLAGPILVLITPLIAALIGPVMVSLGRHNLKLGYFVHKVDCNPDQLR